MRHPGPLLLPPETACDVIILCVATYSILCTASQ